jgi:hypothetical protein
MSLDQFVFAPCVLTGEAVSSSALTLGFFTFMTLAEGKDMNAVRAKWDSVSCTATNWLMSVFRVHTEGQLGGVSFYIRCTR